MTDDRAVNQAFEAFLDALDALVNGPWCTRPADADTAAERRLEDLRAAAARVDPGRWPRHVATLPWRPAGYREPDPDPTDNVVALPELGDDG